VNALSGGRVPPWAWWLLALIISGLIVGVAAWYWRYDADVRDGRLVAWDRWQHRFCVMQDGRWRCGATLP
jgi:hypothetical protein